jgi:hypothetical protein
VRGATRTGAFGKWGLGFVGSEGDPNRQGFDQFFGYNCQRQAHNFYPTHLWRNDQKVMLEGNTRGLTGRQYSHDLIEAEALRLYQATTSRASILPLCSIHHPTPRASGCRMTRSLSTTVSGTIRSYDGKQRLPPTSSPACRLCCDGDEDGSQRRQNSDDD